MRSRLEPAGRVRVRRQVRPERAADRRRDDADVLRGLVAFISDDVAVARVDEAVPGRDEGLSGPIDDKEVRLRARVFGNVP